jgi:phosphoglycolate phosphatase
LPEFSALPDLTGAVIAFDLDGTLIDTAPDLIGTLNTILDEHGHPGLPLEASRWLVGGGARVMLARGFSAAGEAVSAERMDALFARFLELYRARIADESRPFPGVVETLDRLAGAGARLAVCTNKRTELSQLLMDKLALANRFAAIVGPDLAGVAKPDGRHLAYAIEAAGGHAARSLMVGDASTDVGAAKALGVPVVAVSFGYTEVPARELGADLVIDRFDALLEAAPRFLATAAATAG